MNYPMKRVRNLRHFVVRRRLAQTYEESLISTYDFKTFYTGTGGQILVCGV